MIRTVVDLNRGARLVALLAASLALGAVGCSDPYEETGPADEVQVGTLCTPQTPRCPEAVVLRRGSPVGANRLDFRLINEADSATIVVEAVSGATKSSTDAALDAARGDTGESPSRYVRRSYSLAAGETVDDRLVQDELLTRRAFQLRLLCDGCQARLEYALASEPLECRSDEDCSGSWLCSQPDGRCVQCLNDSDCAEDQSCESVTRRCTPQQPSGCSQANGPSLPTSALLLCLLGVGALLVRHRRAVSTLSLLVCLTVFALVEPASARAETPRASLSAGVGPRFLTGQLGEQTQRGIGVRVAQELRGSNFGAMFGMGANYFLTTQPAPPLSRELTLYTLSLGPRFYLPVGPIEMVAGLDYRHVGLVSNSLVRLTGPEINHNAAGGTLEARYQMGPFEVTVGGGFHRFFALEGSLVSMDVAVGLSTR